MLNQIKYVIKQLRHRLYKPADTTYTGEKAVIEKYLRRIPQKNNICVDIAASDGMSQSNTLFLWEQGWSGLAVECEVDNFSILASHYRKFPKVMLFRGKVFPQNIVSVLQACQLPKKFDFLNFDIDSYDYFVLDQLLSSYHPQLICAEINENVPPPICFTVKYSSDQAWAGDHFFGQSLSQLNKLCIEHKYKIVELCYNNAILVPSELSGLMGLTPEEAYRKGYAKKVERKKKFPWDKDMEILQQMTGTEGVKFLKNKFAKYKGKFICTTP